MSKFNPEVLESIFDNQRLIRKPSNVEELRANPITLSEAEMAEVKKLETFDLMDMDLLYDDIFDDGEIRRAIQRDKYWVLVWDSKTDEYFLINTQGYNYSRYVALIDGGIK